MKNTTSDTERGVTIYIISSRIKPPKVLQIEASEEEVVNYLQNIPVGENETGIAVLPEIPSGEASPISYNDNLFIRDQCGFKRIAIENIVYLEASRSYSIIHLKDGKSIMVTVPMAETFKYLPQNHFIRIHRTYVINLKYVESLTGNVITMENHYRLPVGREYRDKVYPCLRFVGTKNRKYLK